MPGALLTTFDPVLQSEHILRGKGSLTSLKRSGVCSTGPSSIEAIRSSGMHKDNYNLMKSMVDVSNRKNQYHFGTLVPMMSRQTRDSRKSKQ